MKQKIYSVYDVKANAFARPFFLHNDGEAFRMFQETVNDTQSLVNKHPGDFALFHLGEYDDQNGIITPLDVPERKVNAIELLEDRYDRQTLEAKIETILSKLTEQH